MNNLKIGDRVRVVFVPGLVGTSTDDVINGMTGTVKDLQEFNAGIEFDEDVGGHTGLWGGKAGYCWYVIYERLEKIEETDTAEETKEEVEEMEVKEVYTAEETKGEKMNTDKEMINHPPHYTVGKVECIDAIESATGDLTGIEAVCTANIIKYVWRWKLKNGVEDLEKAKWYLNKLIEQAKGEK